jgi:hypothetical protein
MTNADFLSQLADHLASHGVGNSTGSSVNIFVGSYPDDPDNMIALVGQIGSDMPNKNIRDFEYPRFQVVVRNTDFETGSGKLREVRELLHDQLAVELVNFYVLRIQAQQDGYPIGRDEKGRYEFSINFTAQHRFRESGADSHA